MKFPSGSIPRYKCALYLVEIKYKDVLFRKPIMYLDATQLLFSTKSVPKRQLHPSLSQHQHSSTQCDS